MSARAIVLGCALATTFAASGSVGSGEGGLGFGVGRAVDGDTIELGSAASVRLLQIDAPELGSDECHSRASARTLRSLLPLGARVTLEPDPRLDDRDRYGRELRYVRRGTLNVNLELVRRGAATVWFYEGERGRYARALFAAARGARAGRRGLWGACSAVWDPLRPATTFPKRRG